MPCRGLVDATSGAIGRGGKKPTMHFGTLLLCGIFQGKNTAPLINGKYCAQVKRGDSQGAESCNFNLVYSELTYGDGSDLSLEDPETKLSVYMRTTMTRQRRTTN